MGLKYKDSLQTTILLLFFPLLTTRTNCLRLSHKFSKQDFTAIHVYIIWNQWPTSREVLQTPMSNKQFINSLSNPRGKKITTTTIFRVVIYIHTKRILIFLWLWLLLPAPHDTTLSESPSNQNMIRQLLKWRQSRDKSCKEMPEGQELWGGTDAARGVPSNFQIPLLSTAS